MSYLVRMVGVFVIENDPKILMMIKGINLVCGMVKFIDNDFVVKTTINTKITKNHTLMFRSRWLSLEGHYVLWVIWYCLVWCILNNVLQFYWVIYVCASSFVISLLSLLCLYFLYLLFFFYNDYLFYLYQQMRKCVGLS